MPTAIAQLQKNSAGINAEQSESKGFISGKARAGDRCHRRICADKEGCFRASGTLTCKRLRVSYLARPSFGIRPVGVLVKAAVLPDADFHWKAVSKRKQTAVGPSARERARSKYHRPCGSRPSFPDLRRSPRPERMRTIPGDKIHQAPRLEPGVPVPEPPEHPWG